MGSYIRQLVAAFGPDHAGLAGRVAYAVYDIAGDLVLGPTGAGVVEAAGSPGTYLAAPAFDSRWAGRIEWTIAGLPGVGALEDFGADLGTVRLLAVSFGVANAGLLGLVGYTLYDATGAVLVARATAGIAESATLPGSYYAAVFLDRGWSGRVVWDIAGRTGVGAMEEFGPGIGGVPAGPPVTVGERPDPGVERP